MKAHAIKTTMALALFLMGCITWLGTAQAQQVVNNFVELSELQTSFDATPTLGGPAGTFTVG